MPLLKDEIITEIEDMFDAYVNPAFEKLEIHLENQVLPCSKVQIVKNLCAFLEAFIRKYLPALTKEKKDSWRRPLNAFFAFSFIWAFGGHFNIKA